MPHFESKALARLAILVGALLVLAGVAFRLVRFETSILTFLPKGDQKLFEVTSKLTDSTLSRAMILRLSGTASREKLAEQASSLKATLLRVPGTKRITNGPDDGLAERFHSVYFGRRFEFASLDSGEIATRFGSLDSLDARANELLEAIASPDGVLEKQFAASDPFRLFANQVRALERSGPELDVHSKQFFAKDGGALLFLEFSGSAFDSAIQTPLLEAIERERESLARSPEKTLLEYTGINKFALASERSTKEDISRIGTLSTVLLVGVYFWLFRRPSRFLFPLVPLAFGTLVGALASQFLFGHVHVITLAFGSSLIGVAIDFPVHLMTHHDLGDEGESPDHALGSVLRSLLLAGGTTVLGLAGLGFAGLPGLAEMSLFSAVGVLVGLLSVAVSAPLLGRSLPPTRSLDRVANELRKTLRFAETRQTIPLALALLALGVAAFGLTHAKFERRLDALNAPGEGLVDEDARLRKAAGQSEDARLLVTIGSNLETALLDVEKLERDLEKFPRHASVSAFLRSENLRKANVHAFKNLAKLDGETSFALERAGFEKAAFEPFERALEKLGDVVPAETLAHELPPELLAPFVVRLGSEVALLTELPASAPEDAIRALVARHPTTHYFSQKANLEALFARVLRRTLWVMVGGFSAVFLIVLARYRNLRKTASALLAPSLSCLATLGVLALLGERIGLLHVLSLLLVLSMGEDYGIFLVDAFEESDPKSEKAALVSVVLASFSTIVSFGMLALSRMPALHALGITVAIGDFGSLLLAPTALLLFRKKSP